MKIKTKNNKTKNIILAVILVVVFAAGLFFAFKDRIFPGSNTQNSGNSGQKINYNRPTDEQVQEGNRIKQSFLEREEKKEDRAVENNDTAKITKSTSSIQITYSELKDNLLSFRTTITGTDQVGKCTARIFSESGEKIAEQTVSSQLVRNYYTCQGFDFEGITAKKGKIEISYNDEVSEGKTEGEF